MSMKKPRITTYTLYGVELKVTPSPSDPNELNTTEGMQYVRFKNPAQGIKVYSLDTIFADTQSLLVHELVSGRTSVLKIDECEFCERPQQ